MESYLIDEAVLNDFVDALIKEKYPGEEVEVHADIKDQAKKSLDHQILKAVLGELTPEQGAELSKLLDQNDEDEAAFENFFRKYNIDLEKVVTSALSDFRTKFMEGGER